MLWILAAFLLFILQIGAVLIFEYRRPHKAVAWIVILFFFPIIGFVLYYFIAHEYSCLRSSQLKTNQLDKTKQKLIERCKENLPNDLLQHSEWIEHQSMTILTKPTDFPITAYNETTIYSEGGSAYKAIMNSIAEARDHIHVEFYIIRDDTLGGHFQQQLIHKAKEGVKVRLLYDGIGCYRLGWRYIKQLKSAGVEIVCFSPPVSSFFRRNINYRNHRKIIVIDGEVGFFGGLNLGSEYLGVDARIGFWRDTHFRIQGDSTLWLQYTFLTDWFSVTGEMLTDSVYYPEQKRAGNELIQVVRSDPNESILELIFSLMISAKKRIYIESPYFIPDSAILLALKTAARKGVDVRIIIPLVPDYKIVYRATLSYVEELMKAGVRFFCYRKGFIHSKVFIADNLICSGSANMDIRSMCSQFELNAIFLDGKVIRRMLEDFDQDLKDSDEIVLNDFIKRSRLEKCKEVFARLFSPLF